MITWGILYFICTFHSFINAETKKLSDIHPEDLLILGKEWRTDGNYVKALSCFRAAYNQKPTLHEALLELSFAHLACQHFNKGFELINLYFQKISPLEKQWHGESLQGKTVLVHTPPWGYGDLFMFLRFIPALRIHGASSIFITAFAPIVQFLYENNIIDGCISCVDLQDYGSYSLITPSINREKSPQCDYEVHLWSLPYLLKITTEKKIPSAPYLFPAEDRARFWHEKLAKQAEIKIGVCWQGADRADAQMKLRSIPHDFFAQLFTIPDIRFYCLHTAEKKPVFELSNSVVFPDLSYDTTRGSFIDTAALISNLDAVITIDTSIAHLAGALGKRVFILLPYAADWRYHIDRTDSPWYPTATLIRQPSPGDWQSVIAHVCKELELLKTTHTIIDKK